MQRHSACLTLMEQRANSWAVWRPSWPRDGTVLKAGGHFRFALRSWRECCTAVDSESVPGADSCTTAIRNAFDHFVVADWQHQFFWTWCLVRVNASSNCTKTS